MKRQRRGFTLVELLIVIAIIGILMAILLPSLGAARAAASRTACQSNIRQFLIAINNYAQDNKDKLHTMNYAGNGLVQYGQPSLYNFAFSALIPRYANNAVLFDPAQPKTYDGRSNRGFYMVDPHPAISTANISPPPVWSTANQLLKHRTFSDLEPDRALVLDTVHGTVQVNHVPRTGAPSWNLGYPDGSVRTATSLDLYNRLRTNGVNGWNNLTEYVRVLELISQGRDPRLGVGSFQWGLSPNRYYTPNEHKVRPW